MSTFVLIMEVGTSPPLVRRPAAMERRERRPVSGDFSAEASPAPVHTNINKYGLRWGHPDGGEEIPPGARVVSSRANPTTTSDKGKQLLLDQFYHAVNEKSIQLQSSGSDSNGNGININVNSSNSVNSPGAATGAGSGGGGGNAALKKTVGSIANINTSFGSSGGAFSHGHGYSPGHGHLTPSPSLLSVAGYGDSIEAGSNENSPKGSVAVIGSGAATPVSSQSQSNSFSVPDSLSRVPNGAHVPLLDSSFRDILRRGGVKYASMDNSFATDEEFATYLLNIDNVVTREAYEEQQQPDQGHKSDLLKPIEKVMGTLSSNALAGFRKQFNEHTRCDANEQIAGLRTYVTKLQEETEQLATELRTNKQRTKTKYQDEVNLNVSKLNELLETLEELEARLNKLRKQIGSTKSKMNLDISQKIKLLEQIDKKIMEHTRTTKERKVKVASTTGALLILVISIWWGYIRMS